MDQGEFEKMKSVLDGDIHSIMSQILDDGIGKDLMEKSLQSMIENADDSLDDKKVLTEMVYLFIGRMFADNPKLLFQMQVTNLLAAASGAIILAYRLGQHNTELQAK
jgi:hypothetical protein